MRFAAGEPVVFLRSGHVTGDVSNVQTDTVATNFRLRWDSKTDLDTDETVIVRLTPHDPRNTGNVVLTAPFSVRNGNHAPTVTLVSVAGTSGDITITYDLDEPDTGDQCDVFAFISTDGGTTYWQTAELTGEKMDQVSGNGKSMTWHYGNDFSNNFSAVSVMLIAWDGKALGNQSKLGQSFPVTNGSGATNLTSSYSMNAARDSISVFSVNKTEEDNFAEVMYYVGNNPYYIYSNDVYRGGLAYTSKIENKLISIGYSDLAMAETLTIPATETLVTLASKPKLYVSSAAIAAGALNPLSLAWEILLNLPGNDPAVLVRVTDKAGRTELSEYRDSPFYTEIVESYFENNINTSYDQQNVCIEYLLIGDPTKYYTINRIEYTGTNTSGNVNWGSVYQTQGSELITVESRNKLVIGRSETSLFQNDQASMRVVPECEGSIGDAKPKDVNLINIMPVNIKSLSRNVQISYYKYRQYNWVGAVLGQTPGTAAGGTYSNSNSNLPSVNSNGNPITYKEFDVNNKLPNQARDGERFVKSNDGLIYYTSDHYISFVKITN